MKEIALKIISNNLLAKLALNLIGDGIQNHIDAYTDIDWVKKTAKESIAISRLNYFDTPVYLIGGYGGDVKMFAISGCDIITEEDIINKIDSALLSFSYENKIAVELNEDIKIDYSKLNIDDLYAMQHSEVLLITVYE